PLGLPFDRSAEVARAYLALMGGSRREVMRVFQHGDKPTDREIAGESLGITPAEWQILTDSTIDAEAPARYYGMGGAGVNTIATVSTLLDRIGIEYTDLIALVETRFLNPDRQLVLAADGATCDLDQTTLKRHDGSDLVPTLSKLHRFIRLWRKLG